MNISCTKLHSDAKIPARAHRYDAGADLYCIESFVIKPGERKSISTGIALEIPDGYAGLIWEKSGLSHIHGIKLSGGVIDAGYRGEIKVGMINLSSDRFSCKKGSKIAQIIIQKIEHPSFVEVSELNTSDRGINGFGSSGK